MQTGEASSRLFPLSFLCLRHHTQSRLSVGVMEAPREKTNSMVIILTIISSIVLMPEFMTLQISKPNGVVMPSTC